MIHAHAEVAKNIKIVAARNKWMFPWSVKKREIDISAIVEK